MRRLGWILGGLYLIDGLVALLGGREAVRWVDNAMGDKLPGAWQKTLKEMETVDKRVIKAWGINNLMAGAGMVLVAMFLGQRVAGGEAAQQG